MLPCWPPSRRCGQRWQRQPPLGPPADPGGRRCRRHPAPAGRLRHPAAVLARRPAAGSDRGDRPVRASPAGQLPRRRRREPVRVLRPTTTSPVLVHHPEDSAAFTSDRILPGLNRVTGAGSADGDDGQGTVRLVASRSLPPGMAVLDAPDIDSVVSANRALAAQLLGRRPVAVRDHRGQVRGRRALGAAAPGPPSGDRRRHRARPRPARGDDRDPRAPRLHAARAGPLDRPHLRHPRDDPHQGRAPPAGERRAAEVMADRPGQRLAGPCQCGAADPQRGPRLPRRTYPRARRGEHGPTAGHRRAADRQRGGLCRGPGAGRGGHDGRHPAARRGSGALAGVRRDR